MYSLFVGREHLAAAGTPPECGVAVSAVQVAIPALQTLPAHGVATHLTLQGTQYLHLKQPGRNILLYQIAFAEGILLRLFRGESVTLGRESSEHGGLFKLPKLVSDRHLSLKRPDL